MAEQSKIEWTDHTFNPWEGCQAVAPECDNCYAEARDQRFTGGTHWGPKAPRRRTGPQNWNKPRRWNAQAEAFAATHGRRQRVFCASLADVFDNAVDPAWRDDLWNLIRECDQLDWLLLTKRPQNIRKMLPPDWGNGWAHVWLGTSAGSQKTAETNIPALLAVPAAVRFVSAEPMLGPMDLTAVPHHDGMQTHTDALLGKYWMPPELVTWPSHHRNVVGDRKYVDLCGFINWVICGGESGPNARPMHPDWALSLRDQCTDAGVPFFFKQWGEYADHTDMHEAELGCNAPSDLIVLPFGGIIGGGNKSHGGLVALDWRERGAAWMCRVGKARAGRLLDGREWNEFPKGAA